ncbi:MAG: hypothetical protein Q7S21_07545 [archaeon]|nr:hypothetical protein [archaeon]
MAKRPARKMGEKKKASRRFTHKRNPTIRKHNSLLVVLMIENQIAQGRPISLEWIKRMAPTFNADPNMIKRILKKRKTLIKREH